MSTIDFSKALADAKTVSFEALDNGDYDVEVVSADAVTSGNGKPMIKTKMKVIAGPHTNRPIINNFTLSLDNPVAVSIFFRHMKCFGLDDQFFAALGTNGSLEPVAQALVGRRARLTLGQREWAGEMRNDVKGVKPYTGAPGGGGPGGFAGPVPGPAQSFVPGALTATPPPPAPAPVPAPQPSAAAQPAPAPAPVAPPTATPAAAPVHLETAEQVTTPAPAAPVAPAAAEAVPSPIPAPPALPI